MSWLLDSRSLTDAMLRDRLMIEGATSCSHQVFGVDIRNHEKSKLPSKLVVQLGIEHARLQISPALRL